MLQWLMPDSLQEAGRSRKVMEVDAARDAIIKGIKETAEEVNRADPVVMTTGRKAEVLHKLSQSLAMAVGTVGEWPPEDSQATDKVEGA